MLFTHLPVYLLIIIFLLSSIAIWIAGIKITYATDVITAYFNLGEAFGGLVFLAIVTNLPEIAITVVAANNHQLDLATSNILGGIAIQTVVLALIDAFGVGKSSSLSFKSHSPVLILEGVALIFILTIIIMGKQFSPGHVFFHTTPFELLILFVWLGSIYLIAGQSKKRLEVSKHQKVKRPIRHVEQNAAKKHSIQVSIIIFIVAASITLLSGWALEISSNILAEKFHMTGVLFGATVLALATSLPEISTGIASARIKEYQMAVSDIFGGNAFLPVLFLLATWISGDAILPGLQRSDIYLTGLGILLTGIYTIGILIGSKKQYFRMGIDSIVVLIVYMAGIAGLVYLG